MSTAHAPLTAADRAELKDALVILRAENQVDLDKATETMNALNADHTAIDPALHEVAANAEYMIQDASSILVQIDAALARLDSGDFGICTTCNQPIPKARLELRPYCPTCVACTP
jgi:DnaK suppressor protein